MVGRSDIRSFGVASRPDAWADRVTVFLEIAEATLNLESSSNDRK